jgi:hypothetical protein
MTEFRLDWLGIIALLLSVPLGILANILTPKAMDWMAKRSAGAAKKRVASLEDEIDRAKKMLQNPSYAVAWMAWFAIHLLGLTLCAMIMFQLSTSEVSGGSLTEISEGIPLGFVTITAALVFYAFLRVRRRVSDVVSSMRDFDMWELKIKDEIWVLKDRYDLKSDTDADQEQSA